MISVLQEWNQGDIDLVNKKSVIDDFFEFWRQTLFLIN